MILLTGEPNTGKSTAINHLIDIIGRRRCGGFSTSEILDENGRRIGFRTHTLTGKEFLLAHVDIESEYQIEEFKVNLKGVEEVAVQEIMKNDKEFLIIDEIGMMQLYSSQFKDAIETLSGSEKTIATISARDNDFTRKIKNAPGNKVYTLTLENRNDMPFLLAKELLKNDEVFLSKTELSKRYSEEPERFEYRDDRVVLRSTHGTRAITRDETGYRRTCDYYKETGTCSHIMAIIRNNIAESKRTKF